MSKAMKGRVSDILATLNEEDKPKKHKKQKPRLNNVISLSDFRSPDLSKPLKFTLSGRECRLIGTAVYVLSPDETHATWLEPITNIPAILYVRNRANVGKAIIMANAAHRHASSGR